MDSTSLHRAPALDRAFQSLWPPQNQRFDVVLRDGSPGLFNCGYKLAAIAWSEAPNVLLEFRPESLNHVEIWASGRVLFKQLHLFRLEVFERRSMARGPVLQKVIALFDGLVDHL